MSFIKNIWSFLKIRKKFWFPPIITVILILSALIIKAQGIIISPFNYSLF